MSTNSLDIDYDIIEYGTNHRNRDNPLEQDNIDSTDISTADLSTSYHHVDTIESVKGIPTLIYDLRIGDYISIRTAIIKITHISVARPTQNGNNMIIITGIDFSNDKVHTYTVLDTDTVDFVSVERKIYDLIEIEQNGLFIIMMASGELSSPKRLLIPNNTLGKEITENYWHGRRLFIEVEQIDHGKEKIVSCGPIQSCFDML